MNQYQSVVQLWSINCSSIKSIFNTNLDFKLQESVEMN